MASFDGGAFDPLAFDAAAFDLEDTPGALYGSAAGSSTASATLTAVAWLAGSAAGTSTAQAYLELDGGPIELPAIGGGKPRPRRPWVVPAQFIKVPSRRRDEEALLLAGCL